MTKDTSVKYFRDQAWAENLIGSLVEQLVGEIDSPIESHSPDEVRRIFLDSISKTPDPDQALINLHRLAEVSFPTRFLRDLLLYPSLLELIMTICSQSQFLSDVLVRYPTWFHWLILSENLLENKSREMYEEEIRKAIEPFGSYQAMYNALRRLQRRELLRIAARDLLGGSDLENTTLELSTLADCIIQQVYELVLEELTTKYGKSPTSPFSIIALGKLGGAELNYSSDIDVLFVIGDDEIIETKSGKKLHAVEFYTQLAELWIRRMVEHTADGKLFRVDVRLRPDGEAGPLVRTAHSYFLYYETRGELWERQMLIKARPVGGDKNFGEDFIDKLAPFVYPSTLFESPRKTIARIKTRIERASADPRNVKLMRGGIRDIEFITQALQMINGVSYHRLRLPSTLSALKALLDEQLLDEAEFHSLRNAYRFFRTVEHRLQIQGNLQVHSIPTQQEQLKVLAYQLGFPSIGEFELEINRHRQNVEEIFRNVFHETSVKSDIGEIFFVPDVDDLSWLSGYGFSDFQKARDLLVKLTHGVTSNGSSAADRVTREYFRKVSINLLEELKASINPDRGLKNILTLVQSYPHPESLFISLENELVRKSIVRLCSFSDRLTIQVSQRSDYIEWLTTQADRVLSENSLLSVMGEDADPILFELGAHIRFLSGVDQINNLHSNLTWLAKKKIQHALNEIYSSMELVDPPFIIVTLGKISGNELGPGGDIDILFLVDERDDFKIPIGEQIARLFINRCSMPSEAGKGYTVDLRLRPEGNSAPLVMTIDSYITYLKRRASLWERQSLTRAKIFSGPDDLKKKIEQIIHSYVYERELPTGWIDEIIHMREKVERRSMRRSRRTVDVKFEKGGMIDIEFLVQAYMLKYGGKLPQIRNASIIQTLKKLGENGIIQLPYVDRLLGWYNTFRKIEYFNHAYMEQTNCIVSDDRGSIRALQRFMGNGELNVELLKDGLREVRAIFNDAIESIRK